MIADGIDPLEAIGEHFREIYFIRRAMVTLREFRKVLSAIQRTPHYQVWTQSMGDDELREWTQACRLFKKHESLIAGVRNDIGGHLGKDAVSFALVDFRTRPVVGRIELWSDSPGKAGYKFLFASEIVATAMQKTLTEGSPDKNFERLLQVMTDLCGEARTVGEMLVIQYLWSKFA